VLKKFLQRDLIEAGCDEAGRGCLAGPVFASAVVLPKYFFHPLLNDSKQMSEEDREVLRPIIEREAVSWAVAKVDQQMIDKINILWASVLAMHKALDQLLQPPQYILVDGNRFKKYKRIPHRCVIQGDAKFASIAAASVLAKTHRDEHMRELHECFPFYNWKQNKGYPTEEHRNQIMIHGICDHHRKSFRLMPDQEQQVLFHEEMVISSKSPF
jgi:ribonuclease HII